MINTENRFSLKNQDYDEQHFHQIDKKLITDLPLEHEYQIRSVLTVVEEAIEKFKISLILPQIIENPKILHKYLKKTKYEDCLKIVKEYRQERAEKKHENLDAPSKTNYHLIKIIDYFHENYKILKILPNWIDDTDHREKIMVKSFEDLYQVAKERFHRPATADLAKEKRLHEVYLSNEYVKKDIEEMTYKMQNKKYNYLWKSAAKTGVIKKLEDELALSQYDAAQFLKQEIAKSSQEIRNIVNSGSTKQRELEEELEKERFVYEKTLKEDLTQEKIVRDEKNKLQLQLQALITKYDQTIYDKYEEEIFLQEEYARQKREFDEFMIEFQREEAYYDEKVRKVEAEYERQHEAKILLFTYNRAAKKVQRWWKKYLRAEKLRQKKLDKLFGKGGKAKKVATVVRGKK